MNELNIIRDYKGFNTKKITFKKILKISESYSIIPLKYQNNKLLLQTPKMNIPFGVSESFKKKIIKLSFLNMDNDYQIQNFSRFLDEFESQLRQIPSLQKLKFISPIQNCYGYANLLNLKIYYYNQKELVSIYSDQKNIASLNDIEKNIYCRSIILIPNLWLNKHSFGYEIYVLQMKIYPKIILLNQYSFIDEEETDSLSVKQTNNNKSNLEEDSNNHQLMLKNHPIYKQYFKLLNYGVPIEQVKFKMKNENLDPDILDKGPEFIYIYNKTKFNLEDNDQEQVKVSNLKELLKNKIVLKQVNKSCEYGKSKKDISRFNFNLNINLQDILEKIGSLRKTEMNLIDR